MIVLMQVHIPCPYEKQWILITANFIDKSFDVLNPDLSNDKFQPMIKTVTTNFKNLFVLSNPRCTYFKIHDFKIRYIEVPKANFRLAFLSVLNIHFLFLFY
jgi:hypothetical protein